MPSGLAATWDNKQTRHTKPAEHKPDIPNLPNTNRYNKPPPQNTTHQTAEHYQQQTADNNNR